MMHDLRGRWILLPAMVLLLAMLACGGFQVRVTPTPEPPTPLPEAAEPTLTVADVEPTLAPTATPAASPTTQPTPTQPPAGMVSGAKARVTAAGGLNVREQPDSTAKQLGRLAGEATVTLVEGPTKGGDYNWWKIDNGAGLVGWVAAGTESEPWLVPATAEISAPDLPGAPKLLDRAIKLGDRVMVTTAANQVLKIRDFAGTNATPIANVPRGTSFTVRGGPVKQNDLVWWELEGETVRGWAAEGDGEDRWLTPVE